MTKPKTKHGNSRKERGNPENRNAAQLSRAEERLQHAEEVKKLQGTIKKQAKESIEDKATIKQQAQDLCDMKEKYGDACRERDIYKNKADFCERKLDKTIDAWSNKKVPDFTVYATDKVVGNEDKEAEPVQPPKKSVIATLKEELFKFIHPSILDEEAWSIHQEIKNLVKRNGVQMICDYLRQLKKEKKILLPQSPAIAYAELVRMGMPTTEGFSEKTFYRYYMN